METTIWFRILRFKGLLGIAGIVFRIQGQVMQPLPPKKGEIWGSGARFVSKLMGKLLPNPKNQSAASPRGMFVRSLIMKAFVYQQSPKTNMNPPIGTVHLGGFTPAMHVHVGEEAVLKEILGLGFRACRELGSWGILYNGSTWFRRFYVSGHDCGVYSNITL